MTKQYKYELPNIVGNWELEGTQNPAIFLRPLFAFMADGGLTAPVFFGGRQSGKTMMATRLFIRRVRGSNAQPNGLK